MAKILGKKTAKQDHEMTKQEQAQTSSELVQAVVKQEDIKQALAFHAEDAEVNAMLTRASEYGQKLDNDPSYQQDAIEIDKAKEVDDYKGIAMLKHLETVLNADELALLPPPMSTKAEQQARMKPGSNKPLIYDKPKASGGRAAVETFYGTLVKSTTLGKQAVARLDAIRKEKAERELKPSEARFNQNIEADERRAQRTLNQLLSAIRLAASVRIIIEDMKEKIPHMLVEWIREPTDQQAPDNADLTMLNIPELGDVVHSPKCLFVYNSSTKDGFKKGVSYSLGSFKRWKVDRAIAIAEKAGRSVGRVTLDDLQDSAKAETKPSQAPPTATAGTITVTKAQRYDANNITEAMSALEGFVGYHDKDTPHEASIAHKAVLDALHSDEHLASMYATWVVLDPIFSSDPELSTRAQAFLKKTKAA